MKTNYLVQEYKNSTKTVFRSRTSEIWNRMILRKCLFFLRLRKSFAWVLFTDLVASSSVVCPSCSFHFACIFVSSFIVSSSSYSLASLPHPSLSLSFSPSLLRSLLLCLFFQVLSLLPSLSLSPLALAQCVWVCACVHEWRLSPELAIHPACFSGMLKWLLNWSSQLCLVFILNTFDLSEHMLARVCTCPHRSEILYTVRPTGPPAACR